MEREELVAADEFCASHRIEFAFISSLQELGLVEITSVKESRFIPVSELKKLEQFVRWRYELDINTEGIDAIYHMLDRISDLQTEITRLKNRLRRFESEE